MLGDEIKFALRCIISDIWDFFFWIVYLGDYYGLYILYYTALANEKKKKNFEHC